MNFVLPQFLMAQEKLKTSKLQVIFLEVYPQLLECSGHRYGEQQMMSQLQSYGLDDICHIG